MAAQGYSRTRAVTGQIRSDNDAIRNRNDRYWLCREAYAQTQRFVELLNGLRRPIHLIDIRRSGTGGMGSWSPRELATIVPKQLTEPYAFLHVPSLAPSVELLGRWRDAIKLPALDTVGIENSLELLRRGHSPAPAAWKHWEVFRESYLLELSSNNGIAVVRAFVENAQAYKSGLAIFLCAEMLDPSFDAAEHQRQDEVYCHRFTLAAAIAKSLLTDFPRSEVYRVDLSLDHSKPQRLKCWRL